MYVFVSISISIYVYIIIIPEIGGCVQLCPEGVVATPSPLFQRNPINFTWLSKGRKVPSPARVQNLPSCEG